MKLAMKKTYINPNMLVVRLAMTQPIAGSLTPDGATFYNENATGEGAVLTKGTSDVNVWDEEW